MLEQPVYYTIKLEGSRGDSKYVSSSCQRVTKFFGLLLQYLLPKPLNGFSVVSTVIDDR